DRIRRKPGREAGPASGGARRVGAMAGMRGGWRMRAARLERWLPRLVVAPSFAASLVFVYGFIAWTVYVSFTSSGVLPHYAFEGLVQYDRLWSTPRWYVALTNLFIFGTLFILGSIVIGALLAVLLDQRIRIE